MIVEFSRRDSQQLWKLEDHAVDQHDFLVGCGCPASFFKQANNSQGSRH